MRLCHPLSSPNGSVVSSFRFNFTSLVAISAILFFALIFTYTSPILEALASFYQGNLK